MTSAAFKEGGLPAENVFKHAAAKTMISVEASDIAITGLADTWIEVTSESTELRRRLKGVEPAESVWVCEVRYTVQFSTVEAGYTSAAAAYEAVAPQLTGAILNGQFDVYLHEYALIYQSAVMENVVTPRSTNAEVVKTTYSVEDNAPPKVDPDGPGGGIGPAGVAAVIVIAIFALVVIACAVRRSKHACVICGHRVNSRYAELALETESMHDLGRAAQQEGGEGSGSAGSGAGATGYPGRMSRSLARLAAQSAIGRGLMGGAAARGISGRVASPDSPNYGTSGECAPYDHQHLPKGSLGQREASAVDEEAAHSPSAPPPQQIDDDDGIELSATMYNPLSNVAL